MSTVSMQLNDKKYIKKSSCYSMADMVCLEVVSQARPFLWGGENYSHSMVHHLTNEVNRYIVGDRFHDGHKTSGHKKATCKYHSLDLCPELVGYTEHRNTHLWYAIHT